MIDILLEELEVEGSGEGARDSVGLSVVVVFPYLGNGFRSFPFDGTHLHYLPQLARTRISETKSSLLVLVKLHF